jgi:hypothetical protein
MVWRYKEPDWILYLLGGGFVLSALLSWILPEAYSTLLLFALPGNFNELIERPWTLLTHPFVAPTARWLSVLIDLVILFQFGQLLISLQRNISLLQLWIWGQSVALFLTLLGLLFYNHPGYGNYWSTPILTALIAYLGWLVPRYRIQVFLIGLVPMRWIAIGLTCILFITQSGQAPLAFLMPLGGTIGGSLCFAFSQNKIIIPTHLIKIPKISKPIISSEQVSQAELDSLLEKVAQKGYDGLSRYEKERLEKASRQ